MTPIWEQSDDARIAAAQERIWKERIWKERVARVSA
jgi:hypothetical protein